MKDVMALVISLLFVFVLACSISDTQNDLKTDQTINVSIDPKVINFEYYPQHENTTHTGFDHELVYLVTKYRDINDAQIAYRSLGKVKVN